MNYIVSGTVTVSCWTLVDADSPEQAIDKAAKRQVAEVHIDGSYEPEEFWHIETDGEPGTFSVEEQ